MDCAVNPLMEVETAPAMEDVVQILGPDGSVSRDRDPGLPEARCRELHRLMILCRVLDERGVNLQRQGRVGFYVTCTGQEASHVGSAAALRDEDWVFPAYREPGIALMRGVPVRALFDQVIGNGADVCKGRQMPCHYAFASCRYASVSSPIGTQIPQAVGAAMAAKIRGDRAVTAVYFGDGATSSSDFHVGLNFAGVFHAPTIFICQNNQWAISLPVQRQTASPSIAVKAKAYGFEGVRVDGNDLLAVYAVTRDAVERARAGGGPALIEAVTYRVQSHSTSDDARRYRSEDEVDEWKKRDPIERFRRHLEWRGIWSQADEEGAWADARGTVARAIQEAEQCAPVEPATLFDDVFAGVPPHLQAQRDALLASLQVRGPAGGAGAAPG